MTSLNFLAYRPYLTVLDRPRVFSSVQESGNLPYHLIQENSQLEMLETAFQNAEYLAIDTEFLRVGTYHPKLCLIQISIQGTSTLLLDLMSDKLSKDKVIDFFKSLQGTFVFYDAEQDLEALQHYGVALERPWYDVQFLSLFLQEKRQPSYAYLVKKHLSIALVKDQQGDDWSLRPLSPEQIQYAVKDSFYLLPLFEKLKARLERVKRWTWVQEEQHLLFDQYSRRLRSFKDAMKQLLLKQLEYNEVRPLVILNLYELLSWRESICSKMDVPRRYILSNATLIKGSRVTLGESSLLESELPEEESLQLEFLTLLDQQKERALNRQAHESSLSQVRELLPAWYSLNRSRNKIDRDLLSLVLRKILKETLQTVEIPKDLLVSSRTLEHFLNLWFELGHQSSSIDFDHFPVEVPLFSGWRYELLGSKIEDFLTGNIHLAYDKAARKMQQRLYFTPKISECDSGDA